MLEVRHLSVVYGQHRALDDISLHVSAGEIVVMLGANGAGKTTLLKSLGGLIGKQAEAEVAFDGKSITRLQPHEIIEAGLGLVPEGRGIFADLSVRENLRLGAFPTRARHQEKENRDRVLTLFPRLGERLTQTARTLSGGEQQRVAIGRALMSAPTILMLDEPSLGLSPLLCTELFNALEKIRDRGVGILLVEQNARRSLAVADRGYILENGRRTGAGAAAALLQDDAIQKAYLGGAD